MKHLSIILSYVKTYKVNINEIEIKIIYKYL